MRAVVVVGGLIRVAEDARRRRPAARRAGRRGRLAQRDERVVEEDALELALARVVAQPVDAEPLDLRARRRPPTPPDAARARARDAFARHAAEEALYLLQVRLGLVVAVAGLFRELLPEGVAPALEVVEERAVLHLVDVDDLEPPKVPVGAEEAAPRVLRRRAAAPGPLGVRRAQAPQRHAAARLVLDVQPERGEARARLERGQRAPPLAVRLGLARRRRPPLRDEHGAVAHGERRELGVEVAPVRALAPRGLARAAPLAPRRVRHEKITPRPRARAGHARRRHPRPHGPPQHVDAPQRRRRAPARRAPAQGRPQPLLELRRQAPRVVRVAAQQQLTGHEPAVDISHCRSKHRYLAPI